MKTWRSSSKVVRTKIWSVHSDRDEIDACASLTSALFLRIQGEILTMAPYRSRLAEWRIEWYWLSRPIRPVTIQSESNTDTRLEISFVLPSSPAPLHINYATKTQSGIEETFFGDKERQGCERIYISNATYHQGFYFELMYDSFIRYIICFDLLVVHGSRFAVHASLW